LEFTKSFVAVLVICLYYFGPRVFHNFLSGPHVIGFLDVFLSTTDCDGPGGTSPLCIILSDIPEYHSRLMNFFLIYRSFYFLF